LLVVIAIIALLVAILMPSLQKAKIIAIRGACLSNARNTMASMHIYAGDFDEFPVNIDNARWAQDWIAPGHPSYGVGTYAIYKDTYGAWPMLQLSPTPAPEYNYYTGSEGMPSHWRGHLLYGKYGSAGTMGCSQSTPTGYWHANHATNINAMNWFEAGSFGSGAPYNNAMYDAKPDVPFRKTPPFVYLGPGVDVFRAVNYHGIETARPGHVTPPDSARRRWSRYRGRSAPLLIEAFNRKYDASVPSTVLSYSLHTRQLSFVTATPEGATTGRPFDTTIGWTDGHASSHINDRVFGRYQAVPLSAWDQGK